MVRRTKTIAALVAVILCAATLLADPAREKQLQQGQDLLEKRAFERAAALFAEVAKSKDPELAARGWYHLALTQERQGKTDEARASYARIRQDYAGQREVAVMAQARLDTLDGSRQAAPPSLKTVAAGDDADAGAFISRDGRYLTRPDWNTGDVAVRDLRTGETKRLLGKTDWDTPPGSAESAMLSPDATAVVYLWYTNLRDTPYELRLITNQPGAKPVTLVASRAYSYFQLVGWASDGRSVLVVVSKPDNEDQLAWVSTRDKTVNPLKSFPYRLGTGRLSLSPDGLYVAYPRLVTPRERNTQGNPVAPASSDQNLYVLPTDGSGVEARIIGGANINESPVWTPDGKRLLFVSDRDGTFGLWSVPVENGDVKGPEQYVDAQIPGRIRPIGMASDGTLYYTTPRPSTDRGRAEVFIAEVDARGLMRRQPTRLVDSKVDLSIAPSWSPEGESVAFLRRRPDLDAAAQNGGVTIQYELVVRSLSQRTERTYVTTSLAPVPPVWSHDGKSVLFRRNTNGGELWRWSQGTAEPRSIAAIAHAMLPTGWQRAALAPDDRTLYLSVPNRIVTFDLIEGTQRPVWQAAESRCSASAPKPCMQLAPSPAISPDGRTLAMILHRSDWNAPRLVRVDVAGDGYRELASPVLVGSAVWAPDGSSIFVTRAHTNGAEIVRVPAAGGAMTPTGIILRQTDALLDVARDGRIVFSDRTRDVSARLMAYENLLSIVKQ